MTSSATNSSRTDAPRAVVDEDVIEFAEYTEDESLASEVNGTAPETLAAPNWFKARTSSARTPSVPKSAIEAPTGEQPEDVLSRSETPTEQPRRTPKPSRKPASKPTALEATEGRRKSRRKSNSSSNQSEKQPATQESFDWSKWKQALRKAVIGAYGTSLLIHVLVLIVLSAVFIQQKVTSSGISTQLSDADGAPEAFDGLVELSLPKAGADLAKSPLMLPTQITDPNLLANPDVFANAISKTGKEEGSAEFGDSDGFQFKMPTGGKAVVKGSFAAWTVPADPKPREDYLILIRIKLPAGLKTYRVADITGEVNGTDDFRLIVPFDQRRPEATRTERNGKVVPVKPNDLLKIVDGYAQIVVSIPGAAALVKDTITLKSKLLKEEQKLEIEF